MNNVTVERYVAKDGTPMIHITSRRMDLESTLLDPAVAGEIKEAVRNFLLEPQTPATPKPKPTPRIDPYMSP